MGIGKRVVVAFGCLAFLCSGCSGGDGDDDDDDGAGDSTGTVTAEWSSFCVGRFTRDQQVYDVFDDPMFKAKTGEEYLLTDYSDTFGPTAGMLYLTGKGPDEFELEANTVADLPITTTCPLNTAVPYYAVFDDVSVYAEEALTTKLCDLTAGTALPETNSSSGYSLASDLAFSGPAIYEVYLNAFSAQCGAAPTGFISVPQTRSFGTMTWLVPITRILHAP